jgi:glycosyltransferase involved in cell wall biosynthesis
MSTAPTVSCVIPVHNGKRDLRRAVDSVLSQLPDVQLILVDDCSSDGSTALAVEMADQDPRIVALTLPRNHGQGFARNVGVAAADAEYVTFLDQDDEHVPGWYGYAVDLLQKNPSVAAVKGDIELVDIPVDVSVARGDARWRAMVNSTIWNVIVRKAIYGVLGGCPTSSEYRTREGNEDVALVTALVQHCQMLVSSRIAARHYIQPNGATAYFLRRTTVVDGRIQYLEQTDQERKSALVEGISPYEAQTNRNLEAIRTNLASPK